MPPMKLMLTLFALAVALYAGLVALLWWGQEKLIFQGTPLPQDFRFDVRPDVQERFIDVPGARLSALHLQLPAPKGIVFFCTAMPATWRAGSSTPTSTGAPTSTCS